MRTRTTRTAVVALAAGGALLVTAPPAFAGHTHVMKLGNGRCVVLAEGAGEDNVVLPASVFDNNPNADASPSLGRSHPLHVLVHLGRPGEQEKLFVYGTPDANAACAAGYVNR